MNQQAERSSNIISDFIESYFERRMARILLLGMISGFPWVLIASSLSIWLKEEGLSRSTIGWAGLIFAVYGFNWLWAPLIDRLRVPVLTDRLGHRKAWILILQVVILVCILFWSTIDPVSSLALVIGAGLVIAICSATQDITIDALRIEQIDKDDARGMAAGAAVLQSFAGSEVQGPLMQSIAALEGKLLELQVGVLPSVHLSFRPSAFLVNCRKLSLVILHFGASISVQ